MSVFDVALCFFSFHHNFDTWIYSSSHTFCYLSIKFDWRWNLEACFDKQISLGYNQVLMKISQKCIYPLWEYVHTCMNALNIHLLYNYVTSTCVYVRVRDHIKNSLGFVLWVPYISGSNDARFRNGSKEYVLYQYIKYGQLLNRDFGCNHMNVVVSSCQDLKTMKSESWSASLA